MNYLIISGGPRTGKSETIYNLADYLINTLGFRIVNGVFPTPKISPVQDFKCIVEGINKAGILKRILINTPTDDYARIDELKAFYIATPNVDLIITSARDGVDPVRAILFSQMAISTHDFVKEVPLGKILRSNITLALAWYRSTLHDLLIFLIKADPYNIN